MTPEQKQLYQKIQAFSLDDSNSEFTFSQRLAKENNWSASYTKKVIEEYKKFVFIATTTGEKLSPSKNVDQVWHLHLIYTQSYWGEFCPNILGQNFHHYPSRGGEIERQKHQTWYNQTLTHYQALFEEKPPEDIWRKLPQENLVRPSIFTHFGQKLQKLQKLKFLSFLLTKKNKQKREQLTSFTEGDNQFNQPVFKLMSILLILPLFINFSNIPLLALTNIFNLTGPDFLQFYITLAVIDIAIAAILKQFLSKLKSSSSNLLPWYYRLPAVMIFLLLPLGIIKIFVGISRGKPVGILLAFCIIITVIGSFFLASDNFNSNGSCSGGGGCSGVSCGGGCGGCGGN